MAGAIRGRPRPGAGSTPTTVDYVNAHGSGTKQNDRHETAAFKRSLGAARLRHADELDQVDGGPLARRDRRDRGRRLRAGPRARRGAADRELRDPDPECDLDYVPRVARERRLDVALSVGSGFGGFQSAMVLAQPGRRRDEPRVARPSVTGIGVRRAQRASASRPLGSAPGAASCGLAADRGASTPRYAAGWPARSRLRRPWTTRRPAHRPDRPVHLRAGRRRAGAGRRRLDPADDDPYAISVRLGGRLRRRRVRPAGAAAAVEPRAAGRRAYQSIAWFYAASTGQISIRHGFKGPCGVVVSDGAGGLDASARPAGRPPRHPGVLAGGTEAPLSPLRAGLPARPPAS